MNHIKSYKIFESEKKDFDWSQLNKEQKKGKLLHLYSSIPVQKEKAEKVIKAIVGDKFTLNDTIIKPWEGKNKNPNILSHDKLRFDDYFDSLLTSKDIRGFNFEGLVAGLFNGKIQPHGSRSDVVLETGERCSIKFLDNKSESPVLGSIYNSIKYNSNIISRIGDRRIFDVFYDMNDEEEDLRNDIFDLSFNGVDLFLIAYPDNKSMNIIMHVIDFQKMKDMVTNGLVTAPKNKPGKWQLRLSTSYKSTNFIKIKIPRMSELELDQLWDRGSREWSKKIFGSGISKRLRTDVIEDIIDNKEEIANNLKSDIYKNEKN